MSEVRGSGREFHTVTAQEWLRGATPHPRPGAAAGRSYPTSEVRGGSREELPKSEVRGSGQEELPHIRGQGGVVGRSYPTPKSRGDGWEEQPHVQGAVAARAQEGLEELSHAEGQEGRW